MILGNVLIPSEGNAALCGKSADLCGINCINEVCAKSLRAEKNEGCADSVTENNRYLGYRRACVSESKLGDLGCKGGLVILVDRKTERVNESNNGNRESIAEAYKLRCLLCRLSGNSAFALCKGGCYDTALNTAKGGEYGGEVVTNVTRNLVEYSVICSNSDAGECVTVKVKLTELSVNVINAVIFNYSNVSVRGKVRNKASYKSCTRGGIGGIGNDIVLCALSSGKGGRVT